MEPYHTLKMNLDNSSYGDRGDRILTMQDV